MEVKIIFIIDVVEELLTYVHTIEEAVPPPTRRVSRMDRGSIIILCGCGCLFSILRTFVILCGCLRVCVAHVTHVTHV